MEAVGVDSILHVDNRQVIDFSARTKLKKLQIWGFRARITHTEKLVLKKLVAVTGHDPAKNNRGGV